MATKKSYSRFFIILQEDQKGYGLDLNKAPSGYAKLESMNDKAKASFYVQNIKKQKGPYNMILIVHDKSSNELINLGQINIDESGKADICSELNTSNVAGTNIGMDKVQGAAICKITGNNVTPVMVGFAGGEELKEWANYSLAAMENKKPAMPVKENTVEIMRSSKKKEMTRADVNNQAMQDSMNSINAEREALRVERQQLEADMQRMRMEQDRLESDRREFETQRQSMETERQTLENDRRDLATQRQTMESDRQALENDRRDLDNQRQTMEKDRQTLENDRRDLDTQRQTMELQRKAMNDMKTKMDADKNRLLMDREALNKKIEDFRREKEEYEKTKKCAMDNQCKFCKYFKVNREDEETPSFNEENDSLKENSNFDEYEEEIERYKDYRKKHKHKDDYDKECPVKKKCGKGSKKSMIYPKEKKEEFFNGVVKDLEKIGCKENIDNCFWYKAEIDKLESMYCVNDYNKYSVIFYPMICYYPYISKHGNFMIGYKYDDDNKLKFLIYAIPGTKELRDQPYEGKTGFVTFMADGEEDNEGYWLMYFDIEKNSVVVPVKRS